MRTLKNIQPYYAKFSLSECLELTLEEIDNNRKTGSIKPKNGFVSQYEKYARSLVNLNDFFPEIDLKFESSIGTKPGTLFLKYQIRQTFPEKPYVNNKESRQLFALLAHQFYLKLKTSKTIEELCPLVYLTAYKYDTKGMFKKYFGAKLFHLLMAIANFPYTTKKARLLVLKARAMNLNANN